MRIIFHLADRNYVKALARARKEIQIALQASAGYALNHRLSRCSAKRSGGRRDLFRRKDEHPRQKKEEIRAS